MVGCSRRTWDRLERRGDHSLVLDRVERACRVNNAPALLQHPHGPLEDPELQAKRDRNVNIQHLLALDPQIPRDVTKSDV